MIDRPSSNGHNGRDAGGRFVKGNPGGKGNPRAKQVADLRRTLLSAVTDDDLRRIVRMLIDKAVGGDVAAAREVLDRMLGKPKATVEADVNLSSDAGLAERLQRATERVAQIQRERLESLRRGDEDKLLPENA